MSGRTCGGCGGVLGRDCWNEADCMWISADMAAQAQQPEPCQGCSEVTGAMRECIGVCVGLTCQEDAEARAAAWDALLTTHAPAPVVSRPEASASKHPCLDPSCPGVKCGPDGAASAVSLATDPEAGGDS